LTQAPKSSLSDLAYIRIRQDIMRCAIPPGASLSEVQFRERYDLTIATTRAALARLVQDGLINAEARRGYVVSSLTIRDVLEVFDLRKIVEAGAVGLAIDRLTDESLADIRAAHLLARGDAGGHAAFLDGNRTFHLSIARASGNERLYRTMERLLDEANRVLYMGLIHFDASNRYRDEHEELVTLIADRNRDAACALMAAQIEGGKEVVVRAISTSPQVLNLELARLGVSPPAKDSQMSSAGRLATSKPARRRAGS
jgi:DNA-binding GntR family transcriptional regulator